MRYLTVLVLAISTGVLGGCGDDSSPAEPDPVFSSSPAAQWAGGLIEISWDALGTSGDPIITTSVGDTLAVVDSGLGSVTALLPTSSNGDIDLSVDLGGLTYAAGTVDVFGSLGVTHYEPWLVSVPQEYPVATGAAVISYYEAPTDSGFAVLDLTTGAQSRYNATWNDPNGPCRTPALGPNPGEAYVCTFGGGNVDAWRLGQNPGIDRSLNLPHGSHFTARLSDSVWLAADKRRIYTFRADFAGSREIEGVTTVDEVEETQDFEFNRDLDLAMPASNGSPVWGIPTFRMSTGELAYWAAFTGETGRWSVTSVTSSTNRGLFYVVAAPVGGATGLYAIDAEDGSITSHLPIDGVRPLQLSAIEYDGDRDLLYLFHSALEAVLVIDPDTFEQVGRISVSDAHTYAWVTMVLGMEEGIGYVVLTSADQGANGTPVLRFRLLQQ